METLADEPNPNPPGSQTLPSPPGQSPPPDLPAADRVNLEAGAETLAVPVLDYHELGLGSPSGGSPVQEELAEEAASSGEAFFAVGDFVWAKVKSHPWWPGQVYDPSLASEIAKNAHRKEHSVLVAYFGDATFAWVEPAQLRPFRAEEFGEMAKQSSAKGFVAAVGDALQVLGKRLEAQLRCLCVPKEVLGGLDGKLPVANYTPREFLECLLDAACDVSECDVLEATMLCSWASSFGKVSFSSGEFEYCPHHRVAELEDRIDVDVAATDTVAEVQGQEEPLTAGIGIVKKPEIAEELLSRGRKKRSMAKLIAEMDLDAIEISDEDEEEDKAEVDTKPSTSKQKKHKDSESLDLENDIVKAEEEAGSGSSRRERKKSKYLSPPYMYPSGSSWCPASTEDTELKTPKKTNEASQVLLSGSPTISKCDSYMFYEDDDDKRSPVYKIDSMTGAEILLEFRSTAINPIHLKWNRSAKTVRGFFNLFRSSVYSSGLDFDAYQKHLENCSAAGGKYANKDMADGSEEGRPERRKRKGGANGNSLLDSSPGTTNHSEQVKAGLKRKMRKEGADGMSPLSVGQDGMDSSEKRKKAGRPNRKINKDEAADEFPLGFFGQYGMDPSKQGKEAGPRRKIKKDGAAEETSLGLVGQDGMDSSVQGKNAVPKMKMKKDGATEETPLGLVLDAYDPSEQVKDGPKLKTTSTIKALVDLNLQIAIGLEEGNSQMIKKGKDGVNGERMTDSGHGLSNGAGAIKTAKKIVKGKDIHCQSTPMGSGPVLVDCHENRKKATDGPGREASIESGREIINGREAGTAKSGQKRKKKDAATYGNPTALLLTFAPGITLPTKEHLIATFRKYGDLIESETRLLEESGCARVVFSKGSDAEKAFNSRDKSKTFGSPVPSYRLCHLPENLSPPLQTPIPKPPLPYIRKSLERMISTLSESSSTEKDAGPSEVLKPEAKENLVGEMKGLLQKVNKMLDGPSAGVFPQFSL